jgi:serine/threonine-protein kinase
MKHVNEPPPNVLDRRGDVPLRVAAAVDRALEKDPEQRFPTMDAFAAELEACLAEYDRGADAEATMVIPGLRRHRRKRVSGWPVGVIVATLVAIAAIVAGLLMLADGNEGQSARASIGLEGVTSYDPFGDDREEHNERVGDATDRDPTSYWPTQTYSAFTKPGVGLVLDAGQPVEVRALRVRTDTPGFTAQIRGGNLQSGPFRILSPGKPVTGTTAFTVDPDVPMRYYVIWITSLAGDVAHVNEVRAFGTA